MTKRCRRCQADLPLTAFHRNRTRKDGHQDYCTACHLENNREWAERRPWVRRATMRRQNAARPRSASRNSAPHQRRAHKQVERAIARGELVRPDRCPRCGKGDSPIHAHHDDYDRPLEIRWLCCRCHGRMHAHERKSHAEALRPLRHSVLGSRRDGRQSAA